MRLNGWQRLWVVVAVLSATLAGTVVLFARTPTDKPEQPGFYAESLAKDVTIVEIETIGEVPFPNELSKEEIARLVKAAMSSSPPTVRAVAAEELRKRAERKASEAKAANIAARAQNLRLYAYGLWTWFAFVALVYAAGWSIGWVLRGFKGNLNGVVTALGSVGVSTRTNTARRKLILGFSIFLGVMLAAATAVVAYAAYQMQTARFGDIFDRLVSQQTQTWVLPTLVVIVGISLVGFIVFIGLWKFHQTNSKK
jgi:hypothetical protein